MQLLNWFIYFFVLQKTYSFWGGFWYISATTITEWEGNALSIHCLMTGIVVFSRRLPDVSVGV